MSYKISKYPVEKLDLNADIQPGFAFKSERFTDNPDDIPLVKGENVHQGYVDWLGAKHWPADEYDSLSKYHLVPGDVVLAMDRPWVTAGLKWSYIKPHDPNSLLVQRVARIRAKNKLEQEYLRHVISSSYFANYLQPIVTGVNVPHISGKQIGAFRIPIPGPKTQRKIAAILTAYDDLIEVNKRRIALLENLAEEIYREWFVRLRFPGHQHTRFVKGVPEGWEMEPFSKLVYMNPRESINKSDFVPYVGMEDLSTTSMHFVSKEERKSASGAKFRNRDTLFPRITPCLENGKRGFVMCLKDQQIGLGSTEFIVFRERVLPAEYIYLLTCNASFRRHAELSMTGASGRQRVQHDCFDYFFIPRPPEDIRNQFVALVRPLLESVAQYSKQIAVLTKTRDLLLPRLISGKLSVEELDIQFPPSMQDQPLAPASADEARHA